MLQVDIISFGSVACYIFGVNTIPSFSQLPIQHVINFTHFKLYKVYNQFKMFSFNVLDFFRGGVVQSDLQIIRILQHTLSILTL